MSQAWHGGQLERAAETYGGSPHRFLDFSTNTHPFAPPIPEDLWAQWRKEAGRYPEPAAEAVRSRLAEVFNVPETCLLPTAGGIEALYLAARLFPGKSVAVPAPAFSDYERALVAAGARVQTVPVLPAEGRIPPAELAERTRDFDAVFFGNPNNPTGTFYARDEMLEIIGRARTRGQSWVVDEAFVDFAGGEKNESLRSVLPECPNLIVAGSLTKFWSVPGLRIGFLATGNNTWRDALAAMQPPWSVGAAAAAWVRDCLTPHAYRQLRESVPAIDSLRRELSAALHAETHVRTCPSDTNFLLLDLSGSGFGSGDVTDRFGRQGVLVRNADSFEGLETGRFLRIAVRQAGENAVLLTLFKRLDRSYSP